MMFHRPTVLERTVRSVTRGLLLAVCLWAAGFAWFLYEVHRASELPERVDGIVVLTGGADRIETAFHLLERERAPRLLITGVSRAATLADLTRLSNLNPAMWAYRVTVGHEAVTTHGNAAEAAAWAGEIQAKTLIVVTSNYHMPRALLEMGRAMPQITLYPAKVIPPVLRDGIANIPAMSLLAGEYTKYLGAALGLSRLQRTLAVQDPSTR